MGHSLNIKPPVLSRVFMLAMLIWTSVLNGADLSSKDFSKSFCVKQFQKTEFSIFSKLYQSASSKELKNDVARAYHFSKKENEIIAVSDCSVEYATCRVGCSKLTLHVPPIWAGNTTVLWSPTTYLDDPTSLTPIICDPLDSLTYTATITHIPTGCFSVTTAKINVNPVTPTAVLRDSAICAIDNANTLEIENMLDLNELIISGFNGGFWTDDDNSGGLNGSIFTADTSMISHVFNFTYTIPGVQGNSGAEACDDRKYPITISVNECFASLGNFVWLDKNGDGKQDADEAPIPNVRAILFGNTPDGTPVTDTLYTDSTGHYQFIVLPGTYYVQFGQPNGLIPTILKENTLANNVNDSDADADNFLKTHSVTLAPGDDYPHLDAGFYALAKLGDYVWQDYNNDGVQDSIERPLRNVTATLSGFDPFGDTIVTQKISTSPEGLYAFENLHPGQYRVTFGQPASMILTTADSQIATDSTDSDADILTLATPLYVIESGDSIPTLDAGFYGTDFGDLPNTFLTKKDTNGAEHVINPWTFLGKGVDGELDGNPDYRAGYDSIGGDNNALSYYGQGDFSIDDEDGIAFVTPMIPGYEACVEVTTTVLRDSAFLTAWIDFNGDSIFQNSEQILFKDPSFLKKDMPVPLGRRVEQYCFDVPSNASFNGGKAHLRFRLSERKGVQFSGREIGGEVEDYWMPFAIIGNYVWFDEDGRGDQNETGDMGLNDFKMQLLFRGKGSSKSSDSLYFEQLTFPENGIDGKYRFIGLVPGKYTIGYPEYPQGMIPTIPKHSKISTFDSDGLYVEFEIDSTAANLSLGENSKGDDFGNEFNFPDGQVDWSFDFGFLGMPEIGGSLALSGAGLAESGTCGNFTATFDACIQNTEATGLNNLKLEMDFDDPDNYGAAFIAMVGTPEIVSSTASENPNFNPNYDGADNVSLFDGASGWLRSDEMICIRFSVELSPSVAVNTSPLMIQATLEGGAVNVVGEPIPDLVSGAQYFISDLSDSGNDPATDNPDEPDHNDSANDPTALSDCWEKDTIPVCNDNIQISLDASGVATLDSDFILEGSLSQCNDFFEITIMDAHGNPRGDQVTCADIGKTLTVKAKHVVSCNSCWGSVTVEDKLPPVVDCNIEWRDKSGNIIASGNEIEVGCDVNLDDIPMPQGVDNCDPNPSTFLILETTTGDACDTVRVTRTFGTEDQYGNQGNTCDLTIKIVQPEVEFPEDITWTCEQYAAFAEITKPIDLHLLIDPAFAENLDLNWDDNIDNPLTDSDLLCGTASAERDTDHCKANLSGSYQDCVLDPNAHEPTVIKTPIHDRDLVDGLEDADLLEMTGSGVPNVAGLTTTGCSFTVTHEDQILAACADVSTDVTFKILRTWTVLNWCSGEVFTKIQIIKVIDTKAPTIVFDDDFETEYRADKTINLSGHSEGRGSGPIEIPTFEDNCSGVDFESIRLFTPVGEGVPKFDSNGNLTGFGIPDPYLPVGTHTLTYEVTDRCGNKTQIDFQIEIIDGIPPVPICREFTRIGVGAASGGLVVIDAETFNEASYDNYAPVHFLVRKEHRDDNCLGFTEHNRFRSQIHFCCENIGDTIDIILKVYDVDPGDEQSLIGLDGNSNECSVRVLVEDKIRPRCEAPEDVWTDCSQVPDNFDFDDFSALAAKFGTATAEDNCGATLEEFAPTVSLDQCGIGTIYRSFRAVDNSGNRSLGSCRQTIMVMAKTDYQINIPGDFEEECDDAAPADLTYEENGCDLLAINVEEQKFDASALGECKQFIKTWSVINWCEYDGSAAPIRLPRRDLNNDGVFGDGTNGSQNTTSGHDLNETHFYVSNGSRIALNGGNETLESVGYYEYKQHIKIFDNTAPIVSYDGDTQFCGGDRDEDPCSGFVSITPTAEDLCTDVRVRWQMDFFTTRFVTQEQSGFNEIEGRFPLGNHVARFNIWDECGNFSRLDIPFEIIDCKAPTPVCFNGLSVALMPTGMVEVQAEDFDASSFDYCFPIELSVNLIEDQNGDGFITPDDYQRTTPVENSILLTCDNQGITQVQLWATEQSPDSVNQSDFCVTYIEVQDPNHACDGSKPASISGKITDESGEEISDVTVSMNGFMQADMTTANDGDFQFENLIEDNDYSVAPMRNHDIRNGVSTFDLLLINKHILNTQRLDSPYKFIAADVNKSGTISTLDLIAIRKVILVVSNEFPNNTSWRFVDKSQVLDENPLKQNLQEVRNFNNLKGDQIADFIGIKIGDVNGDAEPQNINSVDGRSFEETLWLKTEERDFEADERLEVLFESKDLEQIDGYQFTMHFQQKALELIEIQDDSPTQQNFGQTMLDDGILTVSWNVDQSSTAKREKAFKLIFKTKTTGKLSESLSVSSEFTKAEAYRKNGQFLNVGLNFGKAAAATDFALYQNTPNPFKTKTVIGFDLPKAVHATLTISDASGRVVKVISGDYKIGYNQVILDTKGFASGGVLYYRLEAGAFSGTKKMLLVK